MYECDYCKKSLSVPVDRSHYRYCPMIKQIETYFMSLE